MTKTHLHPSPTAHLDSRCIRANHVNADRMRRYAERSPAIVTALAPRIGYDAATRLVRQAEDQGVPLAELIAAEDAGTSVPGHVDALLAMARPYD